MATAVERQMDDEREDTELAWFAEGATVRDICLAASVVRKLGYVPEIRFAGGSSDTIELYTKDVPALIAKLRTSIESSKGGRS